MLFVVIAVSLIVPAAVMQMFLCRSRVRTIVKWRPFLGVAVLLIPVLIFYPPSTLGDLAAMPVVLVYVCLTLLLVGMTLGCMLFYTTRAILGGIRVIRQQRREQKAEKLTQEREMY